MVANKNSSKGYAPKRREAGARSSRTGRSWRIAAAAAIAAAITLFLLLGNVGIAPSVIAPIVAGIIVGVVTTDLLTCVVAGSLGGLVGGLSAGAAYSMQALNRNFETASPYANPDVLVGQLYAGFVTTLFRRNPITIGGLGATTTVIMAPVLTAIIAAGFFVGLKALGARQDLGKKLAGWLVALTLAVVLVATGWTAGASFREVLARQFSPGETAADPFIYMGAYQAMLRGDSYYQGYLKAAANDARLIQENAIRDGKFYSFVSSPSLMREPWTFHLWRVLAPNGPLGVFLLALVASGGVLLATHWGFSRLSPLAALLAPVLLYPILLMSSVWMNIFLPDFWAGLAMVASLAFLARRIPIAAIAFALAAALFRETLVIWLLALVVLAVLHRKESHGMRDLAIAAGALVAFAVLYGMHYWQAGQLIAPEINAGTGGFFKRLVASSEMSFASKFSAPLWYMMWPYGFFKPPGAFFALLGIGGFAISLRGNRLLRWMVPGYGAFWLVYFATIGAASSYWGQQVMPFYLLGVALLLGAIAPIDRDAV